MLDLDAIKARLAAATPGPWWSDSGDPLSTNMAVAVIGGWQVQASRPFVGDRVTPAKDDADLIAHAPTDLAALVAEVERLREELDSTFKMWRDISFIKGQEVEKMRAAIREHREATRTQSDDGIAERDRKLWEILYDQR